MNKTELANTIDFLTKVSFFSEVSRTSMSHLCSNLSRRDVLKNQIIFSKDDPGDCMYVIMKGKVKVHEDNHLFGILSEGECFGEYALIDNKPRSASVTALEDTSILEIEKHHFLGLMLKDAGLAQGLLAVLIKRHRELDIIQERLASSKEALALANSKMNGLINGAMDAIIMFDANFRIMLTNSAANSILENEDVIQRNILFFLDESGVSLLESLVKNNDSSVFNKHLPSNLTVIGSKETQSVNEGTISKFGTESESFYILILRDIKSRMEAEDTINLLTSQTQYLKDEIKELTSTYGILTEDKGMRNILKDIDRVAATDATVLITGETGTGKELVARAIHMASKRNDKPLIRINCGAIPVNLIESELFGHEKGAFTGATVSRKGRFLLADKGTIFLDEIGELPIELQPKLLRIIQEGEFDPVGSSETIKVDVRIIAATHRNLLQDSREAKFREDLYYRLAVFPIEIPALRNRGGDIILIAREMINQFSKKLSKQPPELSEEDLALFISYRWPGNVRELQNLVERAVIISNAGRVNWNEIIPSSSDKNEKDDSSNPYKSDYKILTSEEMSRFEKENILRALKHTRWKISGKNGAAALLKIAPTTLSSKIKALGISRPV